MNKQKTLSYLIFSMLFLQIIFVMMPLAQSDPPPIQPHRFYGTAIDAAGSALPDGTEVKAVTVDAHDGSIQNFPTTVSSGSYDFGTQIVSEGGHLGDHIYFFINDVNTTQSGTFIEGGNTQLNLIDDIPVSSVDNISPFWTVTSPITINGTAADIGANGLKNVTLYYYFSADNNTFTGPYAFGVNSSPWIGLAWSFNFPNVSGFYRFYSQAIDNASNLEAAPVDNDTLCAYGLAPVTSVNTITPYWKTTSPLSITATAVDNTGDIKNVTLYYYYSSDNTTFAGPYEFGVNETPWIDPDAVAWSFNFSNDSGFYRFYSIGADNSSNVEVTPTTNDTICGYDTVAPASSVDEITPHYYDSSEILTLTATANDATSGLKNISLYFSNSTDNFTWSGPFTYDVNITPWVEIQWNFNFTSANGTGYYRFYTRAKDNATNTELPPGTYDTWVLYNYTNSPPTASTNPSPANGSTDVSTSITLSWSAGNDPDGDSVRFDVYFGTDPTPDASELKTSNQSATTYNPGTLSQSTTYYWLIITRDNHSAGTAGAIWHFTTETEETGGPGDGGGNDAPVAQAGGPYTGYVNQAITVSGSGSTDSDGTIAGYRWDWTNDGTYDTGWLTTSTTTYTYTSIGSYTIKLQVKDDDGAYDTDTTTVTITASVGQHPPVADANGPYTGLTFQNITFDGTGSTDDGSITNYTWDFGDNSTSYGISPIHIYHISGVFNVTLMVLDNDGLTNMNKTIATISLDTDRDGWSDELEELYGTDPNSSSDYPEDYDHDMLPDSADPDDDNDGLQDDIEELIGSNPKDASDVTIIIIDEVTYYLVDTNGDGQLDTFYNTLTGAVTPLKVLNGKYLLDINNDGTYDYVYDPVLGATSLYEEAPTGGIPWVLIIIVIAIIIIILLIIVVLRKLLII
jgi:hypothetical protein